MGVYIKGMRMPEDGFECELQAWDNSCNAFALDEKIICDDPNHRHPNCPLVEVAEPHGRLIDVTTAYQDTMIYEENFRKAC